MNNEELGKLTKLVMSINCFECGSRITCYPPVLDTDNDIMFLVNGKDMDEINSNLKENGFVLGGSVVITKSVRQHPQQFWSYTNKDKLNLLITCSEEFYDKFRHATILSKELNLMKKSDRICLFQYVLYGSLTYNQHVKLPLNIKLKKNIKEKLLEN